jgi:hypothetical protein
MRIFYTSSYSMDLGNKVFCHTIRCKIFGYTLFTTKRYRPSKPEDWMSYSTWQTIKDLLYIS